MKFERKGTVVLLGMLQHCLHTRRVMRGLERLNSEQGEGRIEPNPLAFCNRVISLVLQSTVSPHGGDTALVIPFNVHPFRIVGNVPRVNRVIHCNRDLDFRNFAGSR